MMWAIRLLHATVLYWPVQLGWLLAFVTASHADLMYWVALKHINSPSRSSRPGCIKLILNVLLTCIVCVLLGATAIWASLDEACVLAKALILPVLAEWTVNFLSDFLGCGLRVVSRSTTNGAPIERISWPSQSERILVLIGSSAIAASSLFLPLNEMTEVASIVVSASTAYAAARVTCRTSISAVRVVLVVIAVTVLISLTLIYGNLQLWSIWLVDSYSIHIMFGPGRTDYLNATHLRHYFYEWIFPSIASGTMGAFMGILLRFDYLRSVEQKAVSVSSQQNIKNRALSFIIQHKLDSEAIDKAELDKVYYNTAVRAWVAAQVCILPLGAFSFSDAVVPRPAFLLLSIPSSMFSVLVAILAVAYHRDDLGRLCEYVEVWGAGVQDVDGDCDPLGLIGDIGGEVAHESFEKTKEISPV